MIALKTITLENFQYHDALIVNFIDGINVLTGASGRGKSCIRRAIEWCGFNFSIDGIRKEGTKQTSVKMEFTNGVIVERVRTASINRYILNKPNVKEQVFDSIGKSMPEEIKDAIGIEPIEIDGEKLWLNSQPQIALPFLFDKSPTWRMKLFNKLTGNDLLDKLFVQFNKDILRIGREHKSNTERLEVLTEELDVKEIEKEQLKAVHNVVKNQIEKLKEKQQKFDQYNDLLTSYNANTNSLKLVKEKTKKLTLPDEKEIVLLGTKITELEHRKALLNAVVTNNNELNRVSDELSNKTLPALDMACLGDKIDRLDMLKAVIKEQNDIKTRKVDILVNISDVDNKIKAFKKERDILVDDLNECPTCGQVVTEECKKGLKT